MLTPTYLNSIFKMLYKKLNTSKWTTFLLSVGENINRFTLYLVLNFNLTLNLEVKYSVMLSCMIVHVLCT